MMLIYQEILLVSLTRILTKHGPQMNDLIIRNVSFHLKELVTDSRLAPSGEKVHLMTGVILNFPLEGNFSKGEATITSIQDPCLVQTLMKGASLLLHLMNFLTHVNLGVPYCHSRLMVQNLTNGVFLLKLE